MTEFDDHALKMTAYRALERIVRASSLSQAKAIASLALKPTKEQIEEVMRVPSEAEQAAERAKWATAARDELAQYCSDNDLDMVEELRRFMPFARNMRELMGKIHGPEEFNEFLRIDRETYPDGKLAGHLRRYVGAVGFDDINIQERGFA